MSTKKITLSLSRWHKIVERITKEANELQASIQVVFNQTTVTGYASQETALQEKIATAQKNLLLYNSLVSTVALIKSHVQEKNTEQKVHEKIFQQDAFSKELLLVKNLLSVDRTNHIPVTQLKEYFTDNASLLKPEKGLYYHNNAQGVAVQTLDKSLQDKLETIKKSLQNKINNLGDEIADLNKVSLSIEISTVVADYFEF